MRTGFQTPLRISGLLSSDHHCPHSTKPDQRDHSLPPWYPVHKEQMDVLHMGISCLDQDQPTAPACSIHLSCTEEATLQKQTNGHSPWTGRSPCS